MDRPPGMRKTNERRVSHSIVDCMARRVVNCSVSNYPNAIENLIYVFQIKDN